MRPPRLEDAAWVAELTGESGPEPFPAELVEREWTEPRFDLGRDARLTESAYAGVWDGRGGKAWLDFAGQPNDELVEWAEARAREKGLTRALASAWSENEAQKAAFERAGYRLIRNSWRMRVDLADVRDEPVWPEGLTVRTFRPGDERMFYDVHQETFADHWEHDHADPYEEWAHWLLQPPMFEPELWFVVEDGDEPAGIAICHLRDEMPGLGWVQILGVRRPWRRRGLARALLLHAFQAFKSRGLHQAGLGVDAENLTGAQLLYESAGMQVASRRDIYEKEL
ncbi:MAG: GNAT family N-acetyltransferase [Gaiellaceae bacterium]